MSTALQNPAYWLGALVVLAATAASRIHRLAEFSLMVDESTIYAFGASVLEHGYPVLPVGSLQVQLATYELLPYFIAPFVGVFGATDAVIRLHSVLFAIGTAFVTYHTACRWFCLRTGVLAGLLFAVVPWAIFWGQNAFHPQACQFFALLALLQAERILRADAVPARTYYLAALFFSCSFLSWEGVGFMLPVLVISALIVKWGDWRWLQNRHLWIACAIVCYVVVVQGVRRILLMPNYLLVGFGRSEITGPELAFLEPYYLPYFYFDQYFFRYTQPVVALAFALGLLFVRDWRFRFLAWFALVYVVLVANLLSFYSHHYVYAALPAFLIAVAAATVRFVDWAVPGSNPGAGVAPRWSAVALLVLVATLELATAGAYGLKTYTITDEARSPQVTSYGTRLGLERIDFKGMGEDFAGRHVADDPMMRFHPLSVHQYTQQFGGLSMQSWTYLKMLFDPGGDRVFYSDLYRGSPILRNGRELEDVLSRSRRLWAFEPGNLFLLTGDRETRTQFEQRMLLQAETYRAKIYLFQQ